MTMSGLLQKKLIKSRIESGVWQMMDDGCTKIAQTGGSVQKAWGAKRANDAETKDVQTTL
jgi:hypothetical protein